MKAVENFNTIRLSTL